MTSRSHSDDTTTMIGNDAFCPESGAPLSEERHYDESGRPLRAVVDDPGDAGANGESTGDGSTDGESTEGELTVGARRSSTRALLTYFRRCHEAHDEPSPSLYRTASTALTRLKRIATGRQAWDVHVWYALQYRLRRRGYDVDWMDAHAGLRCPGCHGDLQFERRGADLAAYCGANCGGTAADRLPEIRSAIAGLADAAFDDATPTDDDVLRFDG